jgi:hypothetical protein
MSRAALSVKQERFIKEYARSGNGSGSARKAGYKPKAAKEIAYENLTKPHVMSAVAQERARIAWKVDPERVQRRLDTISHAAEADGQYGPAVRAEELLGKSIGMWIDQSVNINVSSEHVQALLNQARQRQREPIDNSDDAQDVVKDSDED